MGPGMRGNSQQHHPGGFDREKRKDGFQMRETFYNWDVEGDRFFEEPDPREVAIEQLTGRQRMLRELREDAARNGMIEPTSTHNLTVKAYQEASKGLADGANLIFEEDLTEDCHGNEDLKEPKFPIVDTFRNINPGKSRTGKQEIFVDKIKFKLLNLRRGDFVLWSNFCFTEMNGAFKEMAYDMGLPRDFNWRLEYNGKTLLFEMQKKLFRESIRGYPTAKGWLRWQRSFRDKTLAQFSDSKMQDLDLTVEELNEKAARKEKIEKSFEWMSQGSTVITEKYKRWKKTKQNYRLLCVVFEIYCSFRICFDLAIVEAGSEIWNTTYRKFTDLEPKNATLRAVMTLYFERLHVIFLDSRFGFGDLDYEVLGDAAKVEDPIVGETRLGFLMPGNRMPVGEAKRSNSSGKSPRHSDITGQYFHLFPWKLHFDGRDGFSDEFHKVSSFSLSFSIFSCISKYIQINP